MEESQNGQHSEVAVLRIQIRGEDLVETARKNGTANGDLSQLEEYLGNDPAFFLLRASSSQWYVITWMPEGKVGVSNRMVYAASQSNLKAAVGANSVSEALQFGTVEDVLDSDSSSKQQTEPAPVVDVSTKPVWSKSSSITTVRSPPEIAPKPAMLTKTPSQTSNSSNNKGSGVFVKKIDPRLAMSKSELDHVDVLKNEDDARNEHLDQMRLRLRNYTPEPAKPEVNPDNHHVASRGSKKTVAATTGGFHTVTLPLSAEAKAALSDFASNVGTTVVELQVVANKCIECVRSFASTESFTPSPTEPRFYIMRTPGSRVFVYSCPEDSAPRHRMVYSTTSASTLSQIQELGCKITHRLSLFAPKECTLIAVAATIRTGQAQRLGADKAIDSVVNYMPSTPAKSLPSRFAANSTKVLDGFTDEEGFRKAFTGVRPNEPEPAPFTKTVSSSSSYVAAPTHQHRKVSTGVDAVDSTPNSGASAWGVKLKSPSGSRSTLAGGFAAKMANGQEGLNSVGDRFGQFQVSTNTENDSADKGIIRSSLPGFRQIPEANVSHGEDNRSSLPNGSKWDPWRSVSSVNNSKPADSADQQSNVPKSTLQSTVYTSLPDDPNAGSIADFMGDITYPPLQNSVANGDMRGGRHGNDSVN